MKSQVVAVLLGASLFLSSNVLAEEPKGFDTEAMISNLEKSIDLSREKWEKLKPVLAEKSQAMKQELQESIDNGYLELEELGRQFDNKSKDAEARFKEMLSSDEAMKVREYLSKLDKQAIEQYKEKLVAELNDVLALTEEQAAKLKPVIEDSLTKMSDLINETVKQGNRSWVEFTSKFEQLSKEFKDKLNETLNQDQQQRFEEYNQKQKEKIHQALFTI